jgi:exonuclease III
VRGISEIEDFNTLCALIDSFDCALDVIVLTEVKLKTTFPLEIYTLRGFNRFACLRSSLGGGGVIAFVRTDISVDEVPLPASPFEKLMLKLSIGPSRFRMIAYYRAPCHQNMSDFMEDLESDLSSSDTKTIIVGDININSFT